MCRHQHSVDQTKALYRHLLFDSSLVTAKHIFCEHLPEVMVLKAEDHLLENFKDKSLFMSSYFVNMSSYFVNFSKFIAFPLINL